MVVVHPSTRELAKILHWFFLSEVVQQKHQSATSNYIGYTPTQRNVDKFIW